MRAPRSWLVLVLALATPWPAAAQEDATSDTDAGAEEATETTRDVELSADEEEARAHFRLAQVHFRRGQFSEAGDEFQQAYELSQRPELLYNVYLSRREAGELAGSIRSLRALLEFELPSHFRREQLTAQLERLEREIAELEQRVRTEERDRVREEDPPEDRTPAVETNSSTWIPGWILAGGGGALLLVGAITGGVALDLYAQVNARCVDSVCPADTEGQRASGQALTLTTDVLLPLGAALAVTGVILALVLEDDPAEGLSFGCGPDGCAAGYGMAF